MQTAIGSNHHRPARTLINSTDKTTSLSTIHSNNTSSPRRFDREALLSRVPGTCIVQPDKQWGYSTPGLIHPISVAVTYLPLDSAEASQTDPENDIFTAKMMEDFNSETDSDYTSYWRDWVGAFSVELRYDIFSAPQAVVTVNMLVSSCQAL